MVNEGAILSNRIDQVIGLIPEDFRDREIVIRALRSRQDSIPFTAPKAMNDRWLEVAGILISMLPNPEEVEWSGQIAKIMAEEVPAE